MSHDVSHGPRFAGKDAYRALPRCDGPVGVFAIIEYPDLEAAFRVLGKIAKLEVFETETFPAEDVKVFLKALV